MLGLEVLDGLTIGLRCSLKRSLSRRLVSPMYCLGRWLHYLYHVNDVLRVTVDVMSDKSGFTCRVECVFLRLTLSLYARP